jgi:hypothetical protein
MKKPYSGLPSFIQDHIKQTTGAPAPAIQPMEKPEPPLRALPPEDPEEGEEEIRFDTIFPQEAPLYKEPVQQPKPILKEEPSGPPILAGEPVSPATNRLARLYARGVSDDFTGDGQAQLRWRDQVETLISDLEVMGREALALDPNLDPYDLESWLEEETRVPKLTLEPPLPKAKAYFRAASSKG